MSRTLSLTARTFGQAAASGEVAVVLIQVEHPSLAAPIRLSSDPTVLLSEEPLRYGTRSTWNGADPATEPFVFTVASFVLPGDQEDAPASLQLVLDLFDAALVTQLRSVTTQATLHLALVLASSPDLVEIEYRGLRVVSADYGEQLTITATRRPIEDEAVPKDRFTKDRFPGLFR